MQSMSADGDDNTITRENVAHCTRMYSIIMTLQNKITQVFRKHALSSHGHISAKLCN